MHGPLVAEEKIQGAQNKKWTYFHSGFLSNKDG